MEWVDQGIVLSSRRHGESSAIVTLLTRRYGRHAGLVRGGSGKRLRGILQPGNTVQARWRARLPEHLGSMTCELSHSFAASVMDDADRLAALSSACALAEAALPEREVHEAVFDGLLILLGAIENDTWPTVYVHWEIGLLGELGFGLDLSECAATGRNDQLAYVSPKSGRAVSLAAGEAYKTKLLPLPAFLVSPDGKGDLGEVADGLRLSGYFLERHVLAHHDQGLPAARRRLAARLNKRTQKE
ncbi:MAG: DNA repair protein RecO [Rhodospirillales bacterium]|jgi:DNA repair protein RecO (recombination protein O)|nr:DNA repair protein RecO [Rhodospirillales bacterium]